MAHRPDISRAVARGDLSSVREIVEAAASSSEVERTRIVNFAPRWTEGDAPPREGNRPDDDGESRRVAAEATPSPAEWFDVTPLALAAMRGHDDIVEYLLRSGADPTLAGCPRDDVGFGMIASADDGHDGCGPPPLEDRPDLHMDAFDAAGKLSRKIRRCRRTQDLLMAVKVGRIGSCTRRINFAFVPSVVLSKMYHP